MKQLLFLLSAFLLTAFLIRSGPVNQPAQAQSTNCQVGSDVVNGLISSQTISGNFGNNFSGVGVCQLNREAVFQSYKLPGYDDLLNIYYTQAKPVPPAQKITISGSATNTNLNFTVDTFLHITGDLNISAAPTGTGGTWVIFVDGNLNFTHPPGGTIGNYQYGSPATGTVFVVKGNLNVHPDVSRINAVLISQGIICTAYDFSGSICPSATTTARALTVNGSLISINANNPIALRRNLGLNNIPAEQIFHQPKYLVILRNLFSDTLKKWGEFAGDVPPNASFQCSDFNGDQLNCTNKGCSCCGGVCSQCLTSASACHIGPQIAP